MRVAPQRLLLVVAIVGLIGHLTWADEADHQNVSSDRIALKGYDPVSYFSSEGPIEGDEQIRVAYQGAVYRFASEANREQFRQDPDRFAPAYGGWCATAMAKDYKYDINPMSYKIVNGRLFVFYKGWRGDALAEWNKDEPNNLTQADANWKRLVER